MTENAYSTPVVPPETLAQKTLTVVDDISSTDEGAIWALEQGVMLPAVGRKFYPDRPITRRELADALRRASSNKRLGHDTAVWLQVKSNEDPYHKHEKPTMIVDPALTGFGIYNDMPVRYAADQSKLVLKMGFSLSHSLFFDQTLTAHLNTIKHRGGSFVDDIHLPHLGNQEIETIVHAGETRGEFILGLRNNTRATDDRYFEVSRVNSSLYGDMNVPKFLIAIGHD